MCDLYIPKQVDQLHDHHEPRLNALTAFIFVLNNVYITVYFFGNSATSITFDI